jgi:hypothetical protein
VLRFEWTTRRDQKVIVLCALSVCLLCLRFVPTGADNSDFEIVDANPFRHAAKESKGVAMTAQPGLDLLVKDKLDIL